MEEESTNGRRARIGREELSARLDFYAEHTEGFEATEEHLDALVAIFHDHRNVFLTGGAGTGKTSLVRSVIMPELDYRNMQWSVTATTGIAGSHLDGKTIHSFFGIGLGPEWLEYYPSKIEEFLPNAPLGEPTMPPQDMSSEDLEGWYNFLFDKWLTDGSVKAHIRSGVISRLRAHEVLLIDEISMCAGDAMLGYLDFMLRQLRDDERPFGGLQLVMIGDFAQLPPVDRRGGASRADWAFMARCWGHAKVRPIELTKVFRQGEPDFIRFLNEIRNGDPVDREYASRFVRNDMTPEETRNYTFLMPTNKQAKSLNVGALHHYPEPTTPLEAEFVIVPQVQKMKPWEVKGIHRVESELVKALRLVSKTTFVRLGYPVMFTVNDPNGRFVNGTRGFVREVNLIPRTALDPFDSDFIVVGVPGAEGEEEKLIPLHRWAFSRNRHQDPYEATAAPPEVQMQVAMQEVSAYPTIRQFPLIPATAITIHKSQGMSMDSAILALSNSFAAGQVYVGLSRLRSSAGLVLTDHDFEAKTDPLVMNYYRSIRESKE